MGNSLSGCVVNAMGRLADVFAWPIYVVGIKGEAGQVVETGTTAITGDFEAIQCLSDTVLASYTSSTLTGDTLVGVTLAAGTILYGRFSAFTLTSGSVIAYKKG